MLLPPQGCGRRTLHPPPAPSVVDVGMAAGTEGDQQAYLGNPRTPVMDMQPLPCPGPAPDLADPAVPFEDPQPEAAEGGAIAPVSRVTPWAAPPNQTAFAVRAGPTDAAPEGALPRHIYR
jgi:hypothetical protein